MDGPLSCKVMSLLFNMLARLVIAFLPRSKHLLISWLQSPSAVILEHPKIKSVTVSIASPSICYEVMGPNAMILVFWMLSFKPTFSLFHFNQEALNSSSLSAIRVVSSACLRLLMSLGNTDSSLCFFQPSVSHDDAKSLQSCWTLYSSVNCSPPVSSVCGILQTRILE